MENWEEEGIVVMEGRDAVRTRPAMYIRDRGERGWGELVAKALVDARLESLAGHCARVEVQWNENSQTITITDNGRPFLLDRVEEIFGKLHWEERLREPGKWPRGVISPDFSIVNFLSDSFQIMARHGNETWSASWKKGIQTKALAKTSKKFSGTNRIVFKPDCEVLEPPSENFRYAIRNVIKETALCTPGLFLSFIAQPSGFRRDYHYPNGTLDYIADEQFTGIQVLNSAEGIQLDISVYQPVDNKDSIVYVNNRFVRRGDAHIGLKNGVRKLRRNKSVWNYLHVIGVRPYWLKKEVNAVVVLELEPPYIDGLCGGDFFSSVVREFVTDSVCRGIPQKLNRQPIRAFFDKVQGWGWFFIEVDFCGGDDCELRWYLYQLYLLIEQPLLKTPFGSMEPIVLKCSLKRKKQPHHTPFYPVLSVGAWSATRSRITMNMELFLDDFEGLSPKKKKQLLAKSILKAAERCELERGDEPVDITRVAFLNNIEEVLDEFVQKRSPTIPKVFRKTK